MTITTNPNPLYLVMTAKVTDDFQCVRIARTRPEEFVITQIIFIGNAPMDW